MKSPSGSYKSKTALSHLTKIGFSKLIIIIFISFFQNALILTVPLYMLQIFDRVLSTGSIETLSYLTVIAAIGVFVYGTLETLRSQMLHRLAEWVSIWASPEIIRSSISHKLGGEFIGAQAAREMSNISRFIGSGMTSLLDLPWAPLFIIIVWILHPLLGLIALIGAAGLILMGIINEFATRDLSKEANNEQIANFKFLDSAIRNAEIVKTMGMTSAIISRWVDRAAISNRLSLKSSDRTSKITGLMKFSRMLLQLTLLGSGAYLVIDGKITAGAMIAASIIAARALAPAEQALASWRSFVSARQSYSRISNLMQNYPSQEGSIDLPEPLGDLSVEGASYVPAGTQKPILLKLSMHARPGEICTIIGPSGAGKSTLARLIVGAWAPTNGVVRLDGANLNDWAEEKLGTYIGYLPQDCELFDASVAENIARMYRPDSEEVVRAAKSAGAHNMILRLPQGYDTLLGENGARLSGGMKQRIALARALYGDPCLIVLDEPTTGLDAENEKELFSSLIALKKRQKTVVIVSHHPGLVNGSDRLVVLRSGRLVTFGTRDDVLAQISKPVNKQEQKDSSASKTKANRRPAEASERPTAASNNSDDDTLDEERTEDV